MPGNYDGNLNTKEPLWEFQMCTSRERAFLFSTTTFLGHGKVCDGHIYMSVFYTRTLYVFCTQFELNYNNCWRDLCHNF